ncbi:MAG: sigma-70 family RNA polymerase sigma factor [Planctomycetota bacterium]
MLPDKGVFDRGDSEREFASLWNAAESKLRGLAVSLVGATADADDVLQHTSIVLWSKFAEYDRTASFQRWAAGVLRYVVCNHQRASRRKSSLFDPEMIERVATSRSNHDELLELRRERLLECLGEMPPADRDLLTTTIGGGDSVRAHADRLGVAASTLFGRLKKLKRQLFRCVTLKLQGA